MKEQRTHTNNIYACSFGLTTNVHLIKFLGFRRPYVIVSISTDVPRVLSSAASHDNTITKRYIPAACSNFSLLCFQLLFCFWRFVFCVIKFCTFCSWFILSFLTVIVTNYLNIVTFFLYFLCISSFFLF